MGKNASKSKNVDMEQFDGLLLSPRVSGLCLLSLAWGLTGCLLAGRRHLVNGYKTLILGEPWMDPFFASNGAFLLLLLMGIAWITLALRCQDTAGLRRSIFALTASLLPLLLYTVRCTGSNIIPASYFEALWFAAASGLSFSCMLTSTRESQHDGHANASPWSEILIVVGSSLIVGLWWFSQSVWYYDNFLLGYNDFGHFAQRVANSASGRGILLESPVLPTFWDHFNPGLLMLVPLWKVWPSPYLLFLIQAFSLSGGGIVVWRVAKQLQLPRSQAVVWALAWLMQPALGQMNLAYTYGWHPISIAIPFLLLGLLFLLKVAD